MIAEIETCRTELHIPVAVACRALEVSESWFYKHRDGGVSPSCRRRDELDEAIEKVFVEASGEYGSPRIHAELVDAHGYEQLSVNTVAERMRVKGLRAKRKRRGRSLTKPDPTAPKFANLLKRNFKPTGINTSWVGDITETRDLGRQAVSGHSDRSLVTPPHRFRYRRQLQSTARV